MRNARKTSSDRGPAVPSGQGKAITAASSRSSPSISPPLATNPASLGPARRCSSAVDPRGHELVAHLRHHHRRRPLSSLTIRRIPCYKAARGQPFRSRRQGSRGIVYLSAWPYPGFARRPGFQAFAMGTQRRKRTSASACWRRHLRHPRAITITVTAIGMLPQGEAVLRRGAMAGDRLFVSGTIGDAALGLKLLRAPWLEAEWGLRQMRALFSSIATAAHGAQCTCLAAPPMRPRGDRRLRWARRRYDEASARHPASAPRSRLRACRFRLRQARRSPKSLSFSPS